MRIHAYRRTAGFPVDLTPVGQAVKELVHFKLISENPPVVVADVENKRHIELLLRVPEAYREFDENDLEAPAVVVDPVAARLKAEEQARREAELRQAEQRQQIADAEERMRKEANEAGTLIGSSIQPSEIPLTGEKIITLGELVVAAHQASGLSREEWNELQGEEREAMIATAKERLTAQAEADEERAREELAEQMRKDAEAEEARQREAAAAAEAAKFTLIGPDKQPIDLKAMDDAQLKEFAKTYSVEVPAKTKGDALRQLIIDKLAPDDGAAKAE